MSNEYIGAENTNAIDKLFGAQMNRYVAPEQQDMTVNKLNGIGWAIKQLQNNNKVTRRGWNSKVQFLKLLHENTDSMMTLPYICIFTEQADVIPWTASQTDLLAIDWEIYK